MKKNKTIFNFSNALLVVLWMPILYLLFYIPYEEYVFLRKIEKEFEKTDAKTIKIKDITDFDWDTVCVFAQYNLLPPTFDESILAQEFEKTYKYDYKNVKGYLPSLWSLGFFGAFLFVKDGKVVKNLTYDTWGFRYSPTEGWHRYYLILNISNTKAVLFDEDASLNDGCINREDAALKKHMYEGEPPYIIMATNLKKDTD